MSENFKRKRRRQTISKFNIALPILCLLLLVLSIWTNHIGKIYTRKNNELKDNINIYQSESESLESKNNSIKNSISEIDKLIEDIEIKLN